MMPRSLLLFGALSLGLLAPPVFAQASDQPAASSSATQPADQIQSAIESMQQANDPSSIVAAYARGAAVNPSSPELLGAYVSRMVTIGLPDAAFQQAQQLVDLDPNNGLAWGVLSYRAARQGQMAEALADIAQAGNRAQNDPFVQTIAGQLLAWYDTNKPAVSDSLRNSLDQMRKAMSGQRVFADAYRAARQDLKQTSTGQSQQEQGRAQPSGAPASQPASGSLFAGQYPYAQPPSDYGYQYAYPDTIYGQTPYFGSDYYPPAVADYGYGGYYGYPGYPEYPYGIYYPTYSPYYFGGPGWWYGWGFWPYGLYGGNFFVFNHDHRHRHDFDDLSRHRRFDLFGHGRFGERGFGRNDLGSENGRGLLAQRGRGRGNNWLTAPTNDGLGQVNHIFRSGSQQARLSFGQPVNRVNVGRSQIASNYGGMRVNGIGPQRSAAGAMRQQINRESGISVYRGGTLGPAVTSPRVVTPNSGGIRRLEISPRGASPRVWTAPQEGLGPPEYAGRSRSMQTFSPRAYTYNPPRYTPPTASVPRYSAPVRSFSSPAPAQSFGGGMSGGGFSRGAPVGGGFHVSGVPGGGVVRGGGGGMGAGGFHGGGFRGGGFGGGGHGGGHR